MGKFHCIKENKWFFANKLCPKDKEKYCNLPCIMHRFLKKDIYKLITEYYKLYTKHVEPIAYKLCFIAGVLEMSEFKFMHKIQLEQTRRLWSLPEPLGHAVHQEYISKNKGLVNKLWYGKARNHELFNKILTKYEKIAKKEYKYYKKYKWPNKMLLKESIKKGYTGKDLYGK